MGLADTSTAVPGLEGTGCRAVVMAVASWSGNTCCTDQYTERAGLRKENPRSSVVLDFLLYPGWVLGEAVPRHAQRGMLSSDRLRWDAPVSKRMHLHERESGRDGSGWGNTAEAGGQSAGGSQ